jgi:hypothetical protein
MHDKPIHYNIEKGTPEKKFQYTPLFLISNDSCNKTACIPQLSGLYTVFSVKPNQKPSEIENF